MNKSFQTKHPRLYYLLIIFIPFIVLGIVSIIPILKTYGFLNIGNDTFVPPIPENAHNMTFEWLDYTNGVHLSTTYVVWSTIFVILNKLVTNIYSAAFTLQFLIFFLSGLGIYKTYNLFNPSHRFWGLIPAIFFIYSPHLFDHLIYYQGTVAIVWVTYIVLKFVKYKSFTIWDVIFLSVLLAVISDLPNPKYHFLLLILCVLAVIIALAVKLLALKDILRNIKYFVLILLCTAYLSVSFLYFGFSFFQTSGITINTRKDYQEKGETLDYGVANIYKMITLFHTPSLVKEDGERASTPHFVLIYYSIPIIVLGLSLLILPKLDPVKRKVVILYYILGLFFIFFSKSSNPPFGFVYEWILSSSQFFAFMRTTAGLVIYAAIFYSLLFGIFFQFLAEKTKIRYFSIALALSIILLAGNPIWRGTFFRKGSSIDPMKYGNKIPKDYFTAADLMEQLHLDAKLDVYPSAVGYQNNDWGYYGYIIYPWLFDKPVIAFKKLIPSGKINSYTNSRYIVHDKSIKDENDIDFGLNKKGTLVFSSKTLDIYRKYDSQTLPHFYTPKTVRVAKDVEASIKKRGLSSDIAFYQSKDITYANKLQNMNLTQPLIEYKKINPTKYRLRLHQAKGIFQLIFSENFHPDWKMYFGNNFPSNKLLDQHTWDKQKKLYFVDRMNESDQSSREEVTEMIASGSISTIGNAPNDPIQFISKQFLNTVQNDNLPSGHFYETFIKSELTSDIQHAKVNTFANAWIIDTDTLCKQMSCITNKNGTYDMELILEFWPQKLKNMTYVISIGTAGMLLLAYFVKIIYRYLFQAKEA